MLFNDSLGLKCHSNAKYVQKIISPGRNDTQSTKEGDFLQDHKPLYYGSRKQIKARFLGFSCQ